MLYLIKKNTPEKGCFTGTLPDAFDKYLQHLFFK